jgi:putative transposase
MQKYLIRQEVPQVPPYDAALMAQGLAAQLAHFLFPPLKLIWADGGYHKGGFVEGVKATLGWDVEIVEHPWSGLRGVWAPKDAVIDWEKIRPSGFHVLKRRWVVERTFAWLSTWRQLAKDYEVLPSSEEAWIYIAMIPIMIRRLAQTKT